MNIVDLTNKMAEDFKNVELDKIDLKKSKELNLTARTMVSLVKLRLEYQSKKDGDTPIAFMEE